MNAKLTVPLAVSALILLTLPANAICWPWQSCATQGATELLVRKNRHGNTGYVDLYFYAQWMRFEDMLDPDR